MGDYFQKIEEAFSDESIRDKISETLSNDNLDEEAIANFYESFKSCFFTREANPNGINDSLDIYGKADSWYVGNLFVGVELSRKIKLENPVKDFSEISKEDIQRIIIQAFEDICETGEEYCQCEKRFLCTNFKEALDDIICFKEEINDEMQEQETEKIAGTMETLGFIKSFSEYIAAGALGTHSETSTYGKIDGKYYVVESEYDDYADTRMDRHHEVDYKDIVKDFAQAIKHENKYQPIYSGSVDSLVEDGVEFYIKDEKLRHDIMAFNKKEKSSKKDVVSLDL